MSGFQIIAYHEEKFQDIGIIKNGLKTKMVSPFMNDVDDYSKPNELFCLSLIFCFYKTATKIVSIRKGKPLDVKVKILCKTLKDQKGYFFQIDLFCGIKDLSIEETKAITELTHKKCPISRLLEGYPQINLFSVSYEQI
ncbi:OsmC family peroxiredoxin [Candidatus Phytoplasma luffae]|uniref:OsmC family peroxiredoxin n=1 Tax=Loofah witches'-broom phytoplasma TaxID=35773 RepID=A0A975IMA3_LOWBP|nr:OsmC family protein [Candidatus Phytoplasma luffae]QTX03245.1 OsmC family peroxiredoxin [Candidatus Phytoplasma luffae]